MQNTNEKLLSIYIFPQIVYVGERGIFMQHRKKAIFKIHPCYCFYLKPLNSLRLRLLREIKFNLNGAYARGKT